VEQSPSWETSSSSASQEILLLLWKPKVHYHVYKSPPLVPILGQMNPVYNWPPRFSKIHSNTVLKGMPRSSTFSPASGFPIKVLSEFHISPCVLYESRQSTGNIFIVALSFYSVSKHSNEKETAQFRLSDAEQRKHFCSRLCYELGYNSL
jgi:hypothetical protein